MNGNRNLSPQAKYGVSSPDFTEIDGMHQYSDDPTVNPFSEQTKDTVGQQTTWRGKLGSQSGQGSFLKFGDSTSPTSMPRPAGA
jgi:hypothetical protein